MSVVPEYGFLRKLFKEAVDNIEYKSSAFWQVYLREAFSDDPNYMVLCEQSPDGSSRRRVDIVVNKYDPNHDTVTALLYVECKRPDGSLKRVEDQVLDAAKMAIRMYGLRATYAMTTVGVHFRTWIIRGDELVLDPLHGTNTRGDRSQYVSADSKEGAFLTETVRLIKTDPPLRDNPIVPSQDLRDMPMAGSDTAAAMEQPSGYGDPAHDTSAEDRRPPQSQHDYTWYQYGDNEAGPSQAAEAEGGEGGMADGGEGDMEEQSGIRSEWVTKLTKVPHMTRANEFVFTSEKGHKHTTTKDDWQKAKINGQTVWVYRGKKTTYLSKEKIG